MEFRCVLAQPYRCDVLVSKLSTDHKVETYWDASKSVAGLGWGHGETRRRLLGGWSAEREVSLRSGKASADALERTGYRVTRVDVARDIAACSATEARRGAQHAAWPPGRGRRAARRAGDPRHPL